MKVWHVNTTARGGGVAELVEALARNHVGGRLEHHRFVTSEDPVVFAATKRIHHRIHGVNRGGLPDAREHAAFLAFAEQNATRLQAQLGDGSVVVLHDPQTLPMAPLLTGIGVPVFWRCHIGTLSIASVADRTWQYLSQFWPADIGLIFSHPALVPVQAAGRRVEIVAPSVDPGSVKNRTMSLSEIRRVLESAGLQRDHASPHSVGMFSERTLDHDPVVLQVSRWDPLKDMDGVLRAFAASPLPRRAHLILCGPSPADVADDPEAGAVLDGVVRQWEGLPTPVRRRVHLVCTALADGLRNDRLVNALQRRATVVTQRSVQEGFGLTVTEAMLKGRPVVASRVGGIPSQITHDRTGLLLDDPADDGRFVDLITRLLADSDSAARLGSAAAASANEHFTTSREAADHDRILAR